MAGKHLGLYEENGLLIMLAYPCCNILIQRADLEGLISKGLIQHVIAKDGRVVSKLLCTAIPPKLRIQSSIQGL